MKPIHLFLPIIITALISCQPSPQAEAVHPPLPEVDIYANYPQKQMDVSDLADVVYIPVPKKLRFESLSSFHSTFDGCVSEDLIVSYTQEGDVEVFNHDGKKENGFNRLGKEEEEYPYIFDLFLDKDRQEIWILKYGIKFNIYALDGTFKRSIKLPDNQNVKILAITFDTTGRKWLNCSGQCNFPDGEIYTSPIEDSANGTIYFDFPQIYRGNESHKVRVRLENGKVVEASAEKGEEYFLNMINMDEGARFVGEIAIGTNYMIQEITGNILFDEKIGGSIHMALGASYPEAGGKNVSGLHWDLIKNMKNGGEIYADDKLIYKDGKFII